MHSTRQTMIIIVACSEYLLAENDCLVKPAPTCDIMSEDLIVRLTRMASSRTNA